ncbi:RNA polymerase I-specific transcription initiation factor RRN3 [Camelus dromedarius]|uniref:RNA polymerase I-specific transcription initiation factor RRN3 n=1 Tax=Camelus dromedarius TaxID=9838 RepID=A0A5N4CY25_CAMDR|nr:RNA polymerase I-specific transcription initiation factor RRN3 [Camelus dromedarius]KAB1263728.1 RNA polymerase I-specific transcription initiation factor RRN3 [Camelus dromedarius]KAB1263730.1 RNA polymerase I-specific transcription initiation factor RRN3 [Camelus dromedarius]
MAAPLLHTRLPGDAAASAAAVKTLGTSRTGLSDMLALENDFFNSPPRKTVRFGGTVTEVLLKYKKVRGDKVRLVGFFSQFY